MFIGHKCTWIHAFATFWLNSLGLNSQFSMLRGENVRKINFKIDQEPNMLNGNIRNSNNQMKTTTKTPSNCN